MVKLVTGETAATYSISGRVTDHGGHGISGVTVSAGLGGSAITDTSGDYHHQQPQHGDCTPSLPTLGGPQV